MNLKTILASTSLVLATLSWADSFVKAPDPSLTPGSLCAVAREYRYSQRIAYCDRDVSSSTKNIVIAIYDQRLGTEIQSMNRGDFKIDHLVPLCIGGSNEMTNLWPQHKSTYVLTDPVEHQTCALVMNARLTQNEAIEYVRQAKENPADAFKVLNQLARVK